LGSTRLIKISRPLDFIERDLVGAPVVKAAPILPHSGTRLSTSLWLRRNSLSSSVMASFMSDRRN